MQTEAVVANRISRFTNDRSQGIQVFTIDVRRTPHQRAQTCNKFRWAEWYCHVIVGPHFQEKGLIRSI
jgi:hypothetical protein